MPVRTTALLIADRPEMVMPTFRPMERDVDKPKEASNV
jgi:hypothetical protein